MISGVKSFNIIFLKKTHSETNVKCKISEMRFAEKVEEESSETSSEESESDADDSGEDVASLKKSPIKKTPKVSSNYGSQKSSSTSSHVS